jgi:hypothetical protein
MAFKLGVSSAERSFSLIAILIFVCSAALRAQTAGDIGAYAFSSSSSHFALRQSADECLLNSKTTESRA